MLTTDLAASGMSSHPPGSFSQEAVIDQAKQVSFTYVNPDKYLPCVYCQKNEVNIICALFVLLISNNVSAKFVMRLFELDVNRFAGGSSDATNS